VVPEYIVNGTTGSGPGPLSVAQGASLSLGILPDGVAFSVSGPNGNNKPMGTSDLVVPSAAAADGGTYTFTTSAGCQASLSVAVTGPACPLAGTPCDDGDPNTVNDVEDGSCNCSGTPPGGTATVCASVANGADDVEQYNANGSMYTGSSDLELISDPDIGGDQTVGLRFNNVGVPQGATIQGAYLRFTVDEVSTGPSSIVIRGQAADNAGAFSPTSNNVSSRARTVASVTWAAPAWPTADVSGADQTTPGLAAIVQEIVDRPGFTANSSMVFVLTGSGRRTAEAYEGSPAGAPQLCITYSTGSASKSGPLASFITLGDQEATVTDNTAATRVPDGDIMIYPNPTSGTLHLGLGNYMGVPLGLEVFNSVQQKVMQVRFDADHGATGEMDMGGLSDGHYHLKFTGARGTVVKTVVLTR
jgi:hypothetical protein